MTWSIVETVTTQQKGCHVEEEANLFSESQDSGQKLQGDKIWFNTRKTVLINTTVHRWSGAPQEAEFKHQLYACLARIFKTEFTYQTVGQA